MTHSTNNLNDEKLKKLLQKDLVDIISKNISKNIDINTDLFTYGIDSIKQMEITAEIKKKLNIEINPVIFVQYDTIEKLCEYLLSNNKEELNNHYKKGGDDQ